MRLLSHHLGLLLSNVPEGQNSIDVNSVWHAGGGVAKAGEELHDWFQAGGMSSITQDFENKGDLLETVSGNSLDSELVDWLQEKWRNIHLREVITEYVK